MASDSSSFWHRVGYTLEQARQRPASVKRRLSALGERDTPEASEDSDSPSAPQADTDGADDSKGRPSLPMDSVVTTGAVALATKALNAWRPRSSTSLGSLLRAGAAGAAAALLVEVVRPLLRGEASRPDLGPRTPEHLLSGAGQGLVYGAVLEPWLPGPPLLKGALYGSAEYALDPAGGITKLLGSRSPLARVPYVLDLLEGMESDDRAFVEHLAFGVAVGVLYGLSSGIGASSGITEED